MIETPTPPEPPEPELPEPAPHEPQVHEPLLHAQPVHDLRQQIDAIDDALLDLFAQRMALAPALKAAKGGAEGVAAMRPAREVLVLKRLIARAGPALDANHLVDVWRQIMAASLNAQTEIEVAIAGAGDVMRYHDVARRYFGHGVRFTREAEVRTALNRAVDQDRVVAVVPWPGSSGSGVWWPCLTETRYHCLSMVAALPMRGEAEVALFARTNQFEATGHDESLALAYDPHHRLTRCLNTAQLTGRELGRASDKLLLSLDGFVPPDDPRLLAALRSGLDGLRVIGCFSRV